MMMLWSRFGILDVRLGNPIFDLGFPKAWDAVFQTGDSGINWIGNFGVFSNLGIWPFG